MKYTGLIVTITNHTAKYGTPHQYANGVQVMLEDEPCNGWIPSHAMKIPHKDVWGDWSNINWSVHLEHFRRRSLNDLVNNE